MPTPKSYYIAGLPESKPIVVDRPFVTENGITLGVHYAHVASAKGRPSSKWSTYKHEVIQYKFAPAQWVPTSTWDYQDQHIRLTHHLSDAPQRPGYTQSSFSWGYPAAYPAE